MYVNVIIFPLWLVINRPEVPWFTALESHQPPGSCREIWPGSTVHRVGSWTSPPQSNENWKGEPKRDMGFIGICMVISTHIVNVIVYVDFLRFLSKHVDLTSKT